MEVEIECELVFTFSNKKQAGRLKEVLEPENQQLKNTKILSRIHNSQLIYTCTGRTTINSLRTTLDLLIQDSILALKVEELSLSG